jgi:enoyl-CoA hydratase
MFWQVALAESLEEDSMSTNYETIRFEIEGNIGLLTINRPDKLNALNELVLKELKEVLSNLDSSLRGLIMTGEGEKAFIAGADIKAMSGMTVEEAKAFGALGQEVTLLFENAKLPIIAAVNGFALGGGCEMAMSADFIYATENAVFGQPEVKLGLIPGFGGTQRLARLVGRNLAKEMTYTGRNMKIEEAVRSGLVLKSFSTKEEMLGAARKTLGFASMNSPHAIALSKQVMNAGNDLTVEEGLKLELEQFANIFSSDDMKEGTTAFMEKRAPDFKGA